jgi:hypothetical protein
MAQSLLQGGILAALPPRNEKPIPPSELFKRLGVNLPTPSQRASLSRSLARLTKSGDVLCYETEVYRQGKGFLYSRS